MSYSKNKYKTWILIVFLCLMIFNDCKNSISDHNVVFPSDHWEFVSPADVNLDSVILDSLANLLGGRGCILRSGYMVKTWGDQAEKSDWMSSVKPIFSTLLFFAIEEGKINGVHQKIYELGWDLKPKDREMEFYHLANMTSGYARPEKPGEAWAYNDYAIQLYHMSLFDKVFREKPIHVLLHPKRLGVLQFEDNISFRKDKPRIYASVRDFARIAYFWLRKGNWKHEQLLPVTYFEKYMKPQTPKTLPHTQRAETDDYLNIGSFGGDSDHFTKYGAGIYGFNWWFNSTGRLHPGQLTWPDVTNDVIMSIGARGNNTVIIPDLDLILVNARGNWGRLEAGDPENTYNKYIRFLIKAVTDDDK